MTKEHFISPPQLSERRATEERIADASRIYRCFWDHLGESSPGYAALSRLLERVADGNNSAAKGDVDILSREVRNMEKTLLEELSRAYRLSQAEVDAIADSATIPQDF